jgi:hypothetical protein
LRRERIGHLRERSPALAKQSESQITAGQKQQQWSKPQKKGLWGKSRPQQYEFAIAGNNEVDDVFLAVACFQPFSNKQAQIPGKRRIRIVDRLILAHQATQLCGNLPGRRLKHRIVKDFIRPNSASLRRGCDQQDENKRKP